MVIRHDNTIPPPTVSTVESFIHLKNSQTQLFFWSMHFSSPKAIKNTAVPKFTINRNTSFPFTESSFSINSENWVFFFNIQWKSSVLFQQTEHQVFKFLQWTPSVHFQQIVFTYMNVASKHYKKKKMRPRQLHSFFYLNTTAVFETSFVFDLCLNANQCNSCFEINKVLNNVSDALHYFIFVHIKTDFWWIFCWRIVFQEFHICNL